MTHLTNGISAGKVCSTIGGDRIPTEDVRRSTPFRCRWVTSPNELMGGTKCRSANWLRRCRARRARRPSRISARTTAPASRRWPTCQTYRPCSRGSTPRGPTPRRGDLLRLHRRCRDGATLSALLYALHLGVVRRWGRLARRSVDPQEGAAELLAALITSLDSFDPDARTPHVQAGVELNVRNHLRRTRREERRRREAHTRIARIAESARADLDAGVHRFEALIERPEVRAANDLACASPSLDRDASRDVESLLVARAILRPRDASLVCLVDVHDLTVAEAASSLGMRFECARKALLRARRRLRDRRGALEALTQPLAHRA